MWHDNETTVDYVNFRLVAKACAELIQDTGGSQYRLGSREAGAQENRHLYG